MRGGDGVLSTSLRASAWILLAAAVVIGGLELLDTVVSSAPADIAPQPWSPSAALGGVVRVVGLAAIGAMITAVVLGVRPRLRQWTSRAHGSP